MKKWHMEGVLSPVAPRKIILPDPGQTAGFCHSDSIAFHKESWLLSCCRSVAAFLIRFF